MMTKLVGLAMVTLCLMIGAAVMTPPPAQAADRSVAASAIGTASATATAATTSATSSAASSAGTAAASAAQPPKETSIYIPYKDLREIFEKEGRGVFLPYEKFLALWRQARDHEARAAALDLAKSPVDALILEAESVANVLKDVVEVKSQIRIELLKAGWHEVPLRLSDVAITRAVIGSEPARLVGDASQGYRLLIEKKGDQPEQLTLTLEYVKAYTKAPGQNSVSFDAPQAPVSRWRIHIPEPDVKVTVEPFLAATEVLDGQVDGAVTPPVDPAATASSAATPDAVATTAASAVKPPSGRQETNILAFVGAAPTVRIDWTPKAEGARNLEALATVQARQEMIVDEGVVRTRATLTYQISRAQLSQLTIEVPADQKVVNVFDANVRQWTVNPPPSGALPPAAPVQVITVQLFEPAKATQTVVVELERFVTDAAGALTVPIVRAVQVGRQQGLVAVQIAQGLRAEVTKQAGLTQLDKDELATMMRAGRWDFSYRYAALPFELVLSIEKVKPRIESDSCVLAFLRPEDLTVDLLTIFKIEQAGVFHLDLDIPDGYQISFVRGAEADKCAAAQVDSHHLEAGPGDKDGRKTRLVVSLSRKALGRVGLAVGLVRKLEEANLRSPTGQAVTLAVAVPRVAPEGLERRDGMIVLYAAESMEVKPLRTDGLRDSSFKEAELTLARLTTAWSRLREFPGELPVLSYIYRDQPVALEISAKRRLPQVTVRQLLVAGVKANVVSYSATFFYEIRYSGVKSLRIDIPTALAEKVHSNPGGLRGSIMKPAPADLAEGYDAWVFGGSSELIGPGSDKVILTWDDKLEKLEVGKSVNIVLPQLKPKEAEYPWGQVVLRKSEAIDLRPADEANETLRPIDPQLDVRPVVADAARAFEFHEDWKMTIVATRYELEEVKRTSIERALIRQVVTRAGATAVQGVYRLRSARQRLAVRLPEGATFDTQPLKINGRPVALERGEKSEFFVPLVGQAAEEPFLLELRYTVPGSGATVTRIDCPAFPEEPAAQEVYLSVYLPEERTLLGWSGPWSPRIRWVARGLDLRPIANRSDADLLALLRQGLTVDDKSDQTFQTDGRPYLFSTLQPSAPPAGSLRLTSLSTWWLNALKLGLVALVGLALLPAGFARRALVIGVALVAMVVLAVFAPTFVMQITDGVLLGACFIVLVIWILWYILVTRPRDPLVTARRQARLAAATAVAEFTHTTRAAGTAGEPAPKPDPDTGAGDDAGQGGGRNG